MNTGLHLSPLGDKGRSLLRSLVPWTRHVFLSGHIPASPELMTLFSKAWKDESFYSPSVCVLTTTNVIVSTKGKQSWKEA